ncbi:hypothetical protein BB560_003522 [Smittium megazygosporum]|uniref:Uncharacterized protein n=1 Tax=Smittium megazygosporum TaxID=133381 RepID=A0A2T9ZBT8_9FUNG|nr:hypothetical protein BB560_003522 [Smittium megazygosporum]
MNQNSTPAAEIENRDDQRPIQVKLVLLGEAAVGKSSLVLRLVNNEFHEHKEPTIGGNKVDLVQNEEEGEGGQSSAAFPSETPSTSSSTNKLSDSGVQSGGKEQKDTSSNKYSEDEEEGGDFEEEEDGDGIKREVTKREAMQYAQSAGLIFLETSAKENINITETFEEIAKKLPFDQILAMQRGSRNEQAGSGYLGGIRARGDQRTGFGFGRSDQDEGNSNQCAC